VTRAERFFEELKRKSPDLGLHLSEETMRALAEDVAPKNLIALMASQPESFKRASNPHARDEFAIGKHFLENLALGELDGSTKERPPMRHHGVTSEGAENDPRTKALADHNQRYFDALAAHQAEKTKLQEVLLANHPTSQQARDAQEALNRLNRTLPPRPVPFTPPQEKAQ
jgi:hypothetical protein